MNNASPLELSVVLPAYKEADSLRQLLPGLKEQVARLSPLSEILIVDAEAAVDDSAAICAANAVRHVFRKGGNNYGDAVRTGIAEAAGEFVVFMDADGSHNPTYIESLWKQRARHDIVIGSRYTSGGATENPMILIGMSYVVNLTFRLAFQLNCKDVTNSFRLYRGAQLRGLHLVSNDFDIIEEILIKLVSGRAHATVIEVPMTFERRKAGVSKRNLVAFAASYFKTMMRLRKFRGDARRELRKESRRP